MLSDWKSVLAELDRLASPSILVSVATVRGSTPREPGTRMLVSKTECIGTIGGGNLEFKAIKIARQSLDAPNGVGLQRFPLGASLGQCCGGLVNLLFEPMVPQSEWISNAVNEYNSELSWVRAVPTGLNVTSSDYLLLSKTRQDSGLVNEEQTQVEAIAMRLLDSAEQSSLAVAGPSERLWYFEKQQSKQSTLHIFGAGHVGQAIVKVMEDQDISIKLIDSRDEWLDGEWPVNVETILTDSAEAEIDQASENSLFLVMTHDHGLDQKLTEQILKRGDFMWFGLIGSLTKRKAFEKRLTRKGFTGLQLDSMTCPIGVDGISSKRPAAIAISVAAELLQILDHKYKAQSTSRSELPPPSIVERVS
jgi:xanthine dehydrogenase accessory factor